jgi:SNF2 family DNA or RNA helicase
MRHEDLQQFSGDSAQNLDLVITSYGSLLRNSIAGRPSTISAPRATMPDEIARKGLVLASLMRLKQICNHPPRNGWPITRGRKRIAANVSACARSPR